MTRFVKYYFVNKSYSPTITSHLNELKRLISSKEKDKVLEIYNNLKWEKESANPIELADIIGVFVDNHDDYVLNMWLSLDKDIFVNITEENADSVIRYLYERFPY